MARPAPSRLPGIRFEAQTPPPGESLPRMDVAMFVGFAASGPVNLPVAVEDAAAFAAIFGADAPLAWDPDRREMVSAYLAPAVRAFFRNGGRRCWVVRVAGPFARANCFPVPGLARLRRTRHGHTLWFAALKARAPGSWSDALRVGAELISQPVTLLAANLGLPIAADVAFDPARELVAGDLMRVNFGPDYLLMFAVDSVSAPDADGDGPPMPLVSPPADYARQNVKRVRSATALWFKPTVDRPAVANGRARFLAPTGRVRTADAVALDRPDAWAPGRPVAVSLHVPPADAPLPGSLVRIDFGSDQLWFSVRETRLADRLTPTETVYLGGTGLWWLKEPPATMPAFDPNDPTHTVDRLRLEIQVRQGDDVPLRAGDLGFEPKHPRFWAGQPADQPFYDEQPIVPVASPSTGTAAAGDRAPLSGFDRPSSFYVPIGMPIVSDDVLGRIAFPTTALERDGLARFSEDLFIDRQLGQTGVESLASQADFIQYESPAPRRLNGMHAALRVEDATLMAVPDAVHRGWTRVEEPDIDAPRPSAPPPRPEWWHFLPCDPATEVPLADAPAREHFLDCRVRVIPPPQFVDPPARSDPTGTFVLAWSTRAGERYTLEESASPDFAGAVPIYRGAADRLAIYGRTPGDYYYRVRAEVEGSVSNWSAGAGVRAVRSTGWHLRSREAYADDVLLATQRAMMRLSAARGDLFAVIGVPEHYREAEAIAHVASLKAPPASGPAASRVPALGRGEARAFSYAALYHPWIIAREDETAGALRRMPPDGAAIGIMARRALTRGAWIAPANEPFRGVLALTPPLALRRRLALQDAQINVLRQEPRAFVALGADTLSDDPDLLPINVRRLLILLRRLALREGATYVFEPNDDAFRRMVQRGFEALLGQLFVRGAFAGTTPATAFQVVTGSALNTPSSIDRGRLIVELRVAPSLPLTFLTVRLVQSGDRRLIAQES